MSKNRKKTSKNRHLGTQGSKVGVKDTTRNRGTSAIGVAIIFMGLAFFSAVQRDYIRAGLSLFASLLATLGYIMHQRVTDPNLKRTLSYIYFVGFVVLVGAIIVLGTWQR